MLSFNSGKWSLLACIFGLVGIALVWIAYLPVQAYRPFCERFDGHYRIEEFSPHLSDLYRSRLTGYLRSGGTPFVEIGNIVLVPLIDNAPDYNQGSFLWRLLHVLIESNELIWSQANGKLFLWSTREYMNVYPDSALARQSSLYRDLIFREAHGPRMYVNHHELKCDLIKNIADSSLDDATSD